MFMLFLNSYTPWAIITNHYLHISAQSVLNPLFIFNDGLVLKLCINKRWFVNRRGNLALHC